VQYRLLELIGYVRRAEFEAPYYAHQSSPWWECVCVCDREDEPACAYDLVDSAFACVSVHANPRIVSEESQATWRPVHRSLAEHGSRSHLLSTRAASIRALGGRQSVR